MTGESRSLGRSSLSHFWRIGLLQCLAVSSAFAQEEPLQTSEVPFRRVFVPQKDLEAIGTDDFVPIDVKLLDDLIRKHAASVRANLSQQTTTDNQGSVQLSSAYYVAKLMGADLVSERSHLSFAGDKRVDEGVVLMPWSLAIQPTRVSGTNLDSPTPLAWTFTERGEPRLAMPLAMVQDGTKPLQVDEGRFESVFGWSKKADRTSTPNKLKFAIEIPNCANSCLILALPPQAEVQDSSTVVQRVADWSQIDRRLSDWRDFPKDVRRDASTGLASESLWLIELGGSQTASFSIVLGGDNRSQRDPSNPEMRRYEQLVRSQNLQHFIDGNEIRTVCDAEILLAPEQPRFRLRLHPGSKLRRLTVNQLDVDWKVDEGWIVAETGLAVQDSTSGNYANVMAEFLTSFAADQLGKIETASPSFDRSYVMSGSTVVQNSSQWRLTHVNCEASRIIQPIEDARTSSVNRIEYAWSAEPPNLALGLERTLAARRCETLTRFSNDVLGTSAVIRARLQFSEQDSSRTKVELLDGWKLQSITSLDSNDVVSVQDELETASAREFQLTWDRVQKNRIAEIELRLFRSAEETVDLPRQIDCQALFHLPGWQRSDTILVEEDDLFQLDARDALLDRLIAEDLVSDWQKPLLPKSNKGHLFRLESQTAPQPLVWQKKWVRPRARSKTEIEQSGIATIRGRHELQLKMAANRSEPLTILFPAKDIIWRRKEGELWVPLTPLPASPALATSDSGLWYFDIRAFGPEPILLAVVQSEFQADSPIAFPVPRILDFEMESQVARSWSNAIRIDCDQASAEWTIDETGAKTLALPAGPKDGCTSITARVSPANSNKKWFFDASELHVAIDTLGSQKALLTLHSDGPFPGPVVIELENGFLPTAIRRKRAESIEAIPVRLDGQRLVIPPQQSGVSGSVVHEVEFAGPCLPRGRSLTTVGQSFSFQWPVFLVDAECVAPRHHLWLPSELEIEGHDSTNWGQNSDWLLWGWSRNVLASLFGNGASKDATASLSDSSALRRFVPSWESAGWRLARVVDRTVEHESGRLDADPSPPVRIGSRSSDRTLLALFFIVTALLTPCLMRLRYHAATWVCAGFIVLAHFAPTLAARFASTGLIGIFVGFVGVLFYELMQRRSNGESRSPHRNSGKWSPWNDRHSENDSGSNHLGIAMAGALKSNRGKIGALGLCFLTCSALASPSSLFGSMTIGQREDPDDKVQAFQILLPMDDTGELVGTTAYVQQEMLDSMAGKSSRAGRMDRGTFPVSAKYSLRVGVRGRFGSADQLTCIYEFLVGEDLAPVRVPVNASQLLLPRFSVDGIDLSLGNKLRSNGSFWTWTPDKPGRRTVQIVAQPVMKQVESDRNKEVSSQVLDIALLPLANATLEILTDSKNSVEVVSQGRVTDPESGRFVAMLGAVDRLNCSIRTPTTKSNAAVTSATENNEVPTMHTELFLQNDVLQAKTIVDFPRSHSFGAQLEMEADRQWLPVGSQWGDANLVETRAGSNLFRRRYVLEWKTPSANVAGGPVASRDRQISVIWIPQTTTQSLNVLFAECLEVGTKRGTLRFARSFPSWSIEGISTWIPAIGSKDRLDWPELKTNLLALSLRIPSNGGFGVLKPKAIVDKPQQARVTTKWSLEQNRETVSSMITWFGSSQTSEPFVLELPDDYQVTEVYNRSGPIRFLQSRAAGKIRLQVLADRTFLEVSDLWVQARRQVEASEKALEPSYRSLPWIELPTSVQSDQSLEIQATERIALNLESDPTVMYGKGLSVPIHLLQKSTSEPQAGATVATRFRALHRDVPLTGTLQLILDSRSTPKELELKAQLVQSVTSRPFFVLEVPYAFKDRWQSESRIVPLACPDEKKAWLQVHLPEPTSSLDPSAVTAIVRFSLRPDDSAAGPDTWTRFRALDTERIPTQLIDAETSPAPSDASIRVEEPQRDAIEQTRSAMSLYQVRDENFMPTPTKRFVLLESQYWLTAPRQHPSQENQLEWLVSDAVEVLSIEMEGKPVPFRQEGDRIRCAWIPSGLCSDVRVFSKHEVRSSAEDKAQVSAPQLAGGIQPSKPLLRRGGAVALSMGGEPLPSLETSDAIGEIAQTCLDVLEQSETSWPKLGGIEPGSDFDAWRQHWSQMSHALMQEWVRSIGVIEQPAFGDAVKRWHSLQSRLGTEAMRRSWVDPTFPQTERPLPTDQTQSSLWLSFFGCVLTVVAATWITPRIGPFLSDRPWWSLLILGFLVWLVTGSWLPTLVMGSVGLVVAIDCYWLVTSRLRRSEIRGPR